MIKKGLILFASLLTCICMQSCAGKESYTGKAGKETEQSENLQRMQKIMMETGNMAPRQIPSLDAITEFPEDFIVVSGILVRYQGAEKEVTVPEGILVIGENAFAKNAAIMSVRLPEGLTAIRKAAFSGCGSLKEVAVPDTLETVGDCAFERCVNLESIDLHMVKNVRRAAFFGCKNLKKVDLSSAEELGEEVFRSAGIQEITGLGKMKSVGNQALENTPMYEKYLADGEGFLVQGALLVSGQRAVGAVEIPEGIKIISDRAFMGNDRITSVTFPDTVLEIGDGAFESCVSLEKVSMPDSVVSLGEEAFGGCSELRQIRLSQCLKKISARCFSGCNRIGEITIPQGCALGDGVFYYYGAGERKLTFPPDIKNLGGSFQHIDDENFDMDGYCFYTTDLSEKCSLAQIANAHGWKLEALRLEEEGLTLHVGDEHVLRFNSGAEADWEVSDCEVLGMEIGEHLSDRKLTAQKEGVAVVTATIYGKEYICTVEVIR